MPIISFPSDVVPLYGVIGGLSCCVLLLITISIIFALVACYYYKFAQGTGHTYNLVFSLSFLIMQLKMKILR